MIVLLLAIFAVYRLALLISTEEGPFELATKVRNLRTQNDWIGRGIRCPLCVGFWLALVAAVLIAPDWVTAIWYWLGIAGAQAALSNALGDSHAG